MLNLTDTTIILVIYASTISHLTWYRGNSPLNLCCGRCRDTEKPPPWSSGPWVAAPQTAWSPAREGKPQTCPIWPKNGDFKVQKVI